MASEIDEQVWTAAEDDAAALRADAERYRFLRSAPVDGTPGRPVIAVPDGPYAGTLVNEADADSAVDTARAAAAPEDAA